jgi:hypothetical protein
MTGRTTGKKGNIGDIIFLYKFLSQRNLIGWWLPIHTEDILPRSDETFRLAVTLQAPLHLERLLLPG